MIMMSKINFSIPNFSRMFSRTLCRILIFPTFPYFVEIHLHKNIFLNKFMNSRRSFFLKCIYNIWMDTSLWIIFWCELCWKQEHFSFCWAIEEVFEHTLFLLLIWKILVKLVCRDYKINRYNRRDVALRDDDLKD